LGILPSFSHIFVLHPMKKLLLLLILGLSFAPMTQAGGPLLSEEVSDKGPVIRYYPNPIQNTLNLEVQLDFVNQYESIEVKVVNLLGQSMIQPISKELNGITAEVKIDLGDVPSGVYFLEVYSVINGNSIKQTRKITKS